jgi:hypothetical protein
MDTLFERLEVFMVMEIQVQVFWPVILCSAAVGYHPQMKAARPSKMMVLYCNATWHHNPKDLNLELNNLFSLLRCMQ